MASAVEICNLALSHIGQRSNVVSIAPADANYEAQSCTRYYPLARDELLQMHAWGFATTRVVLAELADTAPASWEYAYAVPNGVLKILGVLDEDAASDAPSAKYIREGDVIFTNVENATLRYTQQITDTTKFSALFQSALARLLASYLAGAIIKGKEGMAVADAQLKKAMAMLGMAESSDANSERTQTYQDAKPAAIAARE